jgi:hypothetical protein
MNFERYCGMVSAAAILLVFAIVMWTGLWGPLWQDIKGSDTLNLIVAVVGWVVTIAIGWRAFALAQRQIGLANAQIALQQQQIEDARCQVRCERFERLDAAFTQKAREIDELLVAKGYIQRFADLFPNSGQLGGYARVLHLSREQAQDFISHSALRAPYGYGEMIATIMSRMHRLGDMMADKLTTPYSMDQGVGVFYDQPVRTSVEGLRAVSSQLSDRIPIYRQELVRLADERDRYKDDAVSGGPTDE